MYSSFFCEFSKNGTNTGDTTLRLDAFGYGTRDNPPFSNSQNNSGRQVDFPNGPDDGCKLVLGLGPTPTYTEEPSPKRDSILELGPSGGCNAVPHVIDFSGTTHGSSDPPRNESPIGDEGSTSAKRSGGYMTGLVLAPTSSNKLPESQCCPISQQSSDYSMSAISEPGSACTSSDRKNTPAKKCRYPGGCTKGARGATGLCIGHGGGQRCQKPGCGKGAESRTAFCKAHGGGRRCQHLGCTKSAEGRTEYCIAHGGGRRCGHPGGCAKAARGRSGLCIRHGGGKRCKVEGCARSAEGQVGLCISHGGGRRCQFPGGCGKGAQGSTAFCKAHGGGRRCAFAGCTRGAEGSTPLCKGHGGGRRCAYEGGGICPKSVHGGTDYCVAHGGGKRCVVPGCTKSARGRTDCCVRHGGGKRCAAGGCGKSAQGSTDFCKAHGGGKRCAWGKDGGTCDKFARGRSGLCAAHTSQVRAKESGGGMIGPGLFCGLVRADSTRSGFENVCSSSGVSMVSDSTAGLHERPAKRKQLIPPQVLVPLSMKVSPFCAEASGCEKQVEMSKRLDFVVPEGRVHGGGLLSLLGGSLNNAIDGI
ncbi:loricrin-related [Striga hermonthica]|uniref:Loricrin-related n=1 Tax=Striga hermonthica TaxID=68872 RepID=A0A9N7NJI7_STRHE|nr:loricrin-related [Striga hermonthica]